jgi:hypothetical protein
MATLRLSLDDAATRLGCSVATLRRRIRAGTVQAERKRHAGGFTYEVLIDEEPETLPANAAEIEVLRRERDQAVARLDMVLSLLQREQQHSHELAQQLVQLSSPKHESPDHSASNEQPEGRPVDSLPKHRWWHRIFWS